MTTTRNDTETRRATIEAIARKYLEIETLQTRCSDQADFHELAVWVIEAALIAAYNAGHEAATKETTR